MKLRKGKINILLLIVGVVLIGVGVYFLVSSGPTKEAAKKITSFEECRDAGYPVEESYPEKCRTPEGEVFERYVGNELEKEDLIRIDSPRPGAEIEDKSTFTVTGEARGYWFFEGDFPIELANRSGKVIGRGIAVAQDEWMVEEFVPYKAEVEFEESYVGDAVLMLHRHNPSDLKEDDDVLLVPVKIIKATEESDGRSNNDSQSGVAPEKPTDPSNGNDKVAEGKCFVGGCSSHVCSDDPNVVTTCEWKEEYACYKQAKCERQADGQCGWTETSELNSCIEEARKALF